MADENQNATSSNQKVDLDGIVVEILIICKNANSLSSSAAFLNRRGWPTTVQTDIGTGVEYVGDKKPDFVLVSLSHSSPQISMLPDLLVQSFNVPVIGFIETSDATSSARLAQAKIRFKLTGMPSGPSIYRTIRKILADRFQIENDEKSESSGTAADGGVIIQKSVPQVTGKSSQVIKGGEGTAPEATSQGPTSMFFKKGGKSSAPPEDMKSILDPKELSEADAILAEAEDPTKPRRRLKDIEGEQNFSEGSGNMLFGQSVEKGKKQDHVTMIPTPDIIAQVKKSLFGESGEEVTASLSAVDRSDQSPLEKAVEGAMGRFCQTIPDANTIKLEEVNYVGVYPVDSLTTPGYLVVVWQAPEQSAREEFLRGAEHEFANAFSSMKVEGKLEPGFFVQVPPVVFGDWANDKAKFRLSFVHQKREVGIAFFQTDEPLHKPEPPKGDHGMYAVKVDQISTEVPVNFKAFIHFVNNNRFFLYLRNGRVLQPEQKLRLQSRNMDNFYMKSVDLENLRQYMATTYLGGLVKKFKKAA